MPKNASKRRTSTYEQKEIKGLDRYSRSVAEVTEQAAVSSVELTDQTSSTVQSVSEIALSDIKLVHFSEEPLT